jgi:hypothetical protein
LTDKHDSSEIRGISYLQNLFRRQSPFACLVPAVALLIRCLIYLQRCGIASDIISRCIRDGILYEKKQYHNCVFEGGSMEGLARFSCSSSISIRYRIDVEGSDKTYYFHVTAINSYSVF